MQGKTPLGIPPHVTRTGARVAEAEEGLLVALAPVLPARPLGIADISSTVAASCRMAIPILHAVSAAWNGARWSVRSVCGPLRAIV